MEGVTLTGSVQLRGKTYRLGSMGGSNAVAGMQFAKAQLLNLDTSDPKGGAALWDMLRSCFLVSPPCGGCEACDRDDYDSCKQLDEGDWPVFQQRALALCVPLDDIFDVLTGALEQIAARPTPPPSGSSSPDATTSPRSRASSSAPVRQLPAAFQAAQESGDLIDVAQLAR
jgi:hypothetical protein